MAEKEKTFKGIRTVSDVVCIGEVLDTKGEPRKVKRLRTAFELMKVNRYAADAAAEQILRGEERVKKVNSA
jgi:hypothetical protein